MNADSKMKVKKFLQILVILLIYNYFKAQDQTIPQEQAKLRSLQKMMNVLARQRNLLKPKDMKRHKFCLVRLDAAFLVVAPLHVNTHVLDHAVISLFSM